MKRDLRITKVILLVFMILLFAAGYGYSKEKAAYKIPYIPATKIDFVITPTCTFDPAGKFFKYEYKITSLPSSRQDIWSFDMEARIICEEVKTPTGWSGYYSSWDSSSIYSTSVIAWNGKKEEYFSKPGASLEGFSFKSEGLPAIVTTYTEGYVPIPEVPDDRPVIDNRPKAINDCAKKKTIGPVPLPEEPVDPVNFAFRLESLTRQAGKLGWIKSETLTNNWAEMLDGIKDYYNDKSRVKDTLNAFIAELESQRGKQIDDNAYFLLKLNAEFLQRKM